jgi:pyridoxamine 5'-phosphate oxidase
MDDGRGGIFAGDDPFDLARAWLAEAERSELNDPNAIALATCGPDGLPNVRMVLLKEVEGAGPEGGFVFYTNFESAKGRELEANPQAAFTMHWKSLRRQVRARGSVERVEADKADAYFDSRPYQSRIGAWASAQSRPLSGKAALVAEAALVAARHALHVPRPPHWGGFRIRPVEIEFWADGDFRMHDRFRWTREGPLAADWTVTRLNP